MNTLLGKITNLNDLVLRGQALEAFDKYYHAFTTRVQYGFFMNWFGNQPGEGYEYFLPWLGLAASLALPGGGQYALAAVIARRKAAAVAA